MPVIIETTCAPEPRSTVASGTVGGNSGAGITVVTGSSGTTLNTLSQVWWDSVGTRDTRLGSGILIHPQSINWADGNSEWQEMHDGRWVNNTPGTLYETKYQPPNTGSPSAINPAYRTVFRARSIVMWGAFELDTTSNVWGANLGAEVRKWKAWIRNKNTGVWTQIMNSTTNMGFFTFGVNGGANPGGTSRVNATSDGVVFRLGGGGAVSNAGLHFWHGTRADVGSFTDAGTFGGFFTTYQMRVIKWDSAGADNINNARILFRIGGDWWRDQNATNNDGGTTVYFNNPGWTWGICKYGMRDWQAHNCAVFAAPPDWQTWTANRPAESMYTTNLGLAALME